MNEFEELFRLTQENNAMLKEIVEYVRKVQDKDYLSNDYARMTNSRSRMNIHIRWNQCHIHIRY